VFETEENTFLTAESNHNDSFIARLYQCS